MLEYIRSGAQSWGVKLAFGIIILVFVFWGVGNFNDRDYSNVVAVVNGEPIVAVEFEKAYHNAEEYILRNNPGMTREQLVKEHLGRQVLNELIQMTLLSQEAGRAGIEVTPVEMRRAVDGIKAFQNDQGKFDPEVYKRVLAARQLSPSQYEHELANELLKEKMFRLLTSGAWVSPDETRNRYNFLREQRTVDYIFTPARQFLDDVEVSDGEVETWYKNHQNDFAIPPSVEVAYIKVRPEDLVSRDSIGEQAARAWYEANKSRFEQKEQVKAAHILVPLTEDADSESEKKARATLNKIKEELDKGQKFAEMANLYNEEGAAGPSGELGWISRGETVPQFEEAVFAATPGKVTGEVRTPFGLHLILVEEKKEAGFMPFEQVADEAYKAIAFEEGSEKLQNVLDNLIEDNILLKPLKETAEKYGLKDEKSDLLDKMGLMEKLGIKPDGAEALMGIGAGLPLDTALEAGDGYIVARIIKSEPAGIKPLDTVKSEIISQLKDDKALAQAMAKAAATLQKIENKPLSELKAENLEIKKSAPFERSGIIDGFAPDTRLVEAVFDSQPHAWLPVPYSETGEAGPGAMMVYVDEIIEPNPEELAAVSEILATAAKNERIEGLYAMFMQHLIDNAKIEITNQNLVDRVNM